MTDLLDNIDDEKSQKSFQLCGLKLGGGIYGVPVLEVQEVIRPQYITPIPLSPKYVEGLINLRGQIVTVINLRKLFKIKDNVPKAKLISANPEDSNSISEDKNLNSHKEDEVSINEDYITSAEGVSGTGQTNKANYMNIIIKQSEGLFALMVDEILDVMDVDNEQFEKTPSTVDEHLLEFLEGVYKLDDKLLILLNLENILALGSKDNVEAKGAA